MKYMIVVLPLMLGSLSAYAQGTIDGQPLAEPAAQVLREVMATSEVERVRVTSTERSAAKQARVMYGYILRHGVENAYRLYGPEGDSIIAVFERTRSAGRDQRVAAMTAETRRQLPVAHANDRLMHTKDTHYVFDVAMRSVPADRREAFIEAARSHPRVTRFLGPADGEREAFHLEIPRQDDHRGRRLARGRSQVSRFRQWCLRRADGRR